MDNDFQSYIASKPIEELYDILGTLDKEKYPERYKMLMERIKAVENKKIESTSDSVNEPEVESKPSESKPVAKPHEEYASVWIRFAALILDGLLLIPFYLPFIIMGSVMETNGQPNELLAGLSILTAVGALAFGIWNSIIRMGKTGQSLGRKFLNIAVLNSNGQPIGVGSAFFREIIGRAISGIVCYIGYLNAFWDKNNQMWHDKLAKCYVYYVPDTFA